MKKLVSILVILGLAGGGLFYWWQNQADVRVLNKTLPEGVRVEKNFLNNEYKVVNKIDGYEFKVPVEWRGVEVITYILIREELGYTGTSLNLNGKEGGKIGVGIDRFIAGGDLNSDLTSWAKAQSEAFGLVGDFAADTVGEKNIAKTQEDVHFASEYTYFFRNDNVVYSLTSPSEKFIRYIIANGQW